MTDTHTHLVIRSVRETAARACRDDLVDLARDTADAAGWVADLARRPGLDPVQAEGLAALADLLDQAAAVAGNGAVAIADLLPHPSVPPVTMTVPTTGTPGGPPVTTPPPPTVAEMLTTLDDLLEMTADQVDDLAAGTIKTALKERRRRLRKVRAIIAATPTDARGRPIARTLATDHLDDPTTSRAGSEAAGIANGPTYRPKHGSSAHAVLQALAELDRREPTPAGSTTHEVAEYVGTPRNEAAKRVSVLKGAGLLEPCGEQSAQDSPTATPMQRWRLTDTGWEMLHALDREG